MELEQAAAQRLAVPLTVYNFEVEDWHTYHVGEGSVLVHNADCIGPDSPQKLSTKRANELAKEYGFDSAEILKDLIVGDFGEPGSHFNLFYDKATGLLWAQHTRTNVWIFGEGYTIYGT